VNKKQHNKMSCPSLNKLLIEANNNTSSCRIQQHKKSNDFISFVDNTNDTIIENWIDSKGSKVKNWKQKMQGVWFKPENEINQSIIKENKPWLRPNLTVEEQMALTTEQKNEWARVILNVNI
jgi:hypothetical protein